MAVDELRMEVVTVDVFPVNELSGDGVVTDRVVLVVIMLVAEPMVEGAVTNSIAGTFSPDIKIAESEFSSAPLLTGSMPLLSVHWFVETVVLKVTATQLTLLVSELNTSQASIHSARLVPPVLVISEPVSAVLQRIK
jgi:hypothetical protein